MPRKGKGSSSRLLSRIAMGKGKAPLSRKRKGRPASRPALEYLREPDYQSNNPYEGGLLSSAILGPDCLDGVGALGSITQEDCPGAIVDARKAYLGTFYSGHLLNAEFGGTGDAENVTVLTGQANSAHKNFDNPVKGAVRLLKKIYDALWDQRVDTIHLRYGIEVTIRPSDARWSTDGPGSCICKHVECHAEASPIEFDGRVVQGWRFLCTGEDRPKPLDPKHVATIGVWDGKLKGLLEKANQSGEVSNPEPARP